MSMSLYGIKIFVFDQKKVYLKENLIIEDRIFVQLTPETRAIKMLKPAKTNFY